jgi:hypothetical protein
MDYQTQWRSVEEEKQECSPEVRKSGSRYTRLVPVYLDTRTTGRPDDRTTGRPDVRSSYPSTISASRSLTAAIPIVASMTTPATSR